MASFDIGAKLKQERLSQGLALETISQNTRIPGRFLEAIESGDFSRLPGLIFARNFVRQFAVALNLDPEPLLLELPKQDESAVRLPDPPVRPRSSYHRDRAIRSVGSSLAWLLLAGGASFAAYVHFNHTLKTGASSPQVAEEHSPVSAEAAVVPKQLQESNTATPALAGAPSVRETGKTGNESNDELKAPPAVVSSAALPPAVASPVASNSAPTRNGSMPVQVSMVAHEPSWVQITADGKPAFTGTLQSNETKQFSAAEQVKILTGNAGGLTISLNGKTLEPLGPPGQIRNVKLTAEGPQFLSKVPQPAYDPL